MIVEAAVGLHCPLFGLCHRVFEAGSPAPFDYRRWITRFEMNLKRRSASTAHCLTSAIGFLKRGRPRHSTTLAADHASVAGRSATGVLKQLSGG